MPLLQEEEEWDDGISDAGFLVTSTRLSSSALGSAAAVLSLVFADKDRRGGLSLKALCLCLCYEMRAGDVEVEGYAGG